MSTLDIGFPSQDTKQSNDPLHGDSGDAQYFIFVNAVIYTVANEKGWLAMPTVGMHATKHEMSSVTI